jgi:hypothetical protein
MLTKLQVWIFLLMLLFTTDYRLNTAKTAGIYKNKKRDDLKKTSRFLAKNFGGFKYRPV